jgi:DNA-binding PadR family transcriptional regulator
MRPAQPLGSAEHALLGLISLQPRHGYELADWFAPDGELGEVCATKVSLLYAHLKRLDELGYVVATTEMLGARPPRHVYHLTEAGAGEFWRWLDQPARRNREIRGDFLLKLYFSERIPSHDTIRLVSRQLAIAREELAAQERDLERHAQGSFPHLLRQMRLVATRGTIGWLEAYRIELAGRGITETQQQPSTQSSC